MADNKAKRDGRDDIKVDSNDSSEVEYLHRKFPEKNTRRNQNRDHKLRSLSQGHRG